MARMSVPSPCANICRLDQSQRLCVGCFRSLAEIAAWGRASDEERLEILKQCQDRRAQAR